VIVTGANRGIGLEYVRQLLLANPAPKHLIATTRQADNPELDKLRANHQSLHVLRLEVKNYQSFGDFAKQVEQIVGTDGVDTLINNAGILVNKNLTDVSAQDMIDNFEVNTVSPLMLTKALLPLLKVSAANRKTAVVNITSQIGSIDDNTSGGLYPYRTSKTALNMVSKCLAVDLKPSAIKVIALHPGWVQTDMGGPNAKITTETSVSNMINTIKSINDSTLGDFLNYDGKPIPL